MGTTAKKTAVLAIAAVVGFAAPITLYAAGSRYFEPVTAADAMPPYEILTRVRTLALDPIGEPVRRGPYYILHAYDRRGTEVRVVADAQFGDVLSVMPATLLTPGPGTVGGARIIHVPAPGEETADAAAAGQLESDEAAPEETVPPAPKPRRAGKDVARREPAVRRRPFSSASPPPAERRAILSAPPPTAADGLSPIYPTPRFSGAEEAATAAIPPSAAAPVVPAAPAAPPSSDAPPAQN
jgi:hypothetical protein